MNKEIRIAIMLYLIVIYYLYDYINNDVNYSKIIKLFPLVGIVAYIVSSLLIVKIKN